MRYISVIPQEEYEATYTVCAVAVALRDHWGLSSAGDAFLRALADIRELMDETHPPRRGSGKSEDGDGNKTTKKYRVSRENLQKIRALKEAEGLNGLTDGEVVAYILTGHREIQQKISDDPTPTQGIFVELSEEAREWLEVYRGTQGLSSVGEAASHFIQERTSGR